MRLSIQTLSVAAVFLAISAETFGQNPTPASQNLDAAGGYYSNVLIDPNATPSYTSNPLTGAQSASADHTISGVSDNNTITSPVLTFGQSQALIQNGGLTGSLNANIHPIALLAASGISWLGVLFVFLTLIAGWQTTMAFMKSHDFQSFVTRSAHWLILAGFFGFMSYFVW